jgi:hypothetical protein
MFVALYRSVGDEAGQGIRQFPGFGEGKVRVLIAVDDTDLSLALTPSLPQAEADKRECPAGSGTSPVGRGFAGYETSASSRDRVIIMYSPT